MYSLKHLEKKLALAFSQRTFHSDEPAWIMDFAMNLAEAWLELACSCKLLIAEIELWPYISSDRDSSLIVAMLVHDKRGFTDCGVFGIIFISDPPRVTMRRVRNNKCTPGAILAPATYQTRNLKGGIHTIRWRYYDRALSPLH